MARGGKGGKGQKPTFTRVIPKFLQQYETMLTGNSGRPRPDDGEVISGGGEFTDGGIGSGSGNSGMPGGVMGGGAAARGGGSGSAFGDYDEEEVAALEAYMKTHPSKEEDKEALRKRARELSASIGSSKDPSAKGGEAAAGTGGAAGTTKGGREKPPPSLPPPEEPIEYTDASGKLKFNKRPASAAGSRKRDEGGGNGFAKHKKAKRTKPAKLNNSKLLSFGEDEDG